MAIEIIKERMVVVWNDDGSFRGASLDERFLYEDGSTRNAQRPLTEADADDLVGKIESDIAVQLATAQVTIESLTAERDALQAKLDEITPSHNPRMIDPQAWYSRFTREEIIAIAKRNATDPIVQQILGNMDDSIALRKEDATYQMSLDHVNAIQGVGYLTQIGILTKERAAELFVDSREDEA